MKKHAKKHKKSAALRRTVPNTRPSRSAPGRLFPDINGGRGGTNYDNSYDYDFDAY